MDLKRQASIGNHKAHVLVVNIVIVVIILILASPSDGLQLSVKAEEQYPCLRHGVLYRRMASTCTNKSCNLACKFEGYNPRGGGGICEPFRSGDPPICLCRVPCIMLRASTYEENAL